MTALQELNAYLRRLELRLRLFVASRGAAAVAAFALVLTLLLVWIGNRFQFAGRIVLPFRIFLFLALAAAVSSLLAIPLLRLNRRRLSHIIEQRVPGLEQRLLTVTERPNAANPFTEIVAEDALRVAREHRAEELTSTPSLFALTGAAAVAAVVLIWLIAAGPGYWGYGASLLWTGSANAGKRPLYDIAVRPGDKAIRRKSDQMITAQLLGFSARNVTLYARSGGAAKWEQTPMQPQRNANGYQFLFGGVSDPVEYYVQADAYRSKHYTLSVKDLPGIERVRVALHFPPALRLNDTIQDPGGDIRAVQGTQANISVLTDMPLDHGFLVLENGSKIELARADGNWLTAHLPINKDGSYHVATLDSGEAVRLSDDYFIEAKKDEPPSVRILRPGRDPRVSPIEELPVTVDAADDFGIEGLDLRYSVNGGPEQTIPLLKSKGTKEAQSGTTLYFENLKVEPGDLVSFYATARDANTTSRTPMVFAQAEPFDFKFSQSQQAGGMAMGGSGQDDNISERQKQIILATFNELNKGNDNSATLKEHARFLSDLESKLGDQAKTLANRMSNRDLSSTNSQFENFSKLMSQASSEMNDAVTQLKPGKWHDALSPEQKALQSLLRADAMFRDIQVAFGATNPGSMGGGAQRDLARMFDLELDTSKNQYETNQSPGSVASDQQKAIDEAFERLQALAKRQQELAQQASQQQALEQRWQEEQLRREAEELRRQMQQLAQNSQGQPSSSPQNSQQSSSSPSQSSRQGASGSNMQSQQTAEAMRRASNAIQRAEEEMRKAVSDHDRTAEQRAASELAQAEAALNNMLHQQAGSSMAELSQRAQQIADAQKDLANRLKQIYGSESQSGRNSRELSSNSGSGEMPEMDDPNSPRWPYSYRRRLFQPLPSSRPATEQEKGVSREKEALAQQLEQLERQLQQQQTNLAANQPDAASKLRKALSEAEEKELALRMQKNAEWIRQGYGERNLGMEDSVTAGLEQLSRDLQGVEQALNSSKQNPQNASPNNSARALAEIRALREELERGQEPGEGQPGAQPQHGAYSPTGDGQPALSGADVQDAIDQLSGLRAQLGPADHGLGTYIDGTLGYLHHLYNADPALLDGRIGRDAVANLQRLETELSRRVVQQQIQGARTGAAESAPEKYRDAVAEYFRKLSK